MANFRTHLSGGALVSGAAGFVSYGEGLTNATETQLLFLVGTAASLLPDIDADDSKPVRGLFNLTGIVAGFLVAFALAERIALLEQLLVWIGVALVVAFPLRWAFARMTVHRGIWHSLLMALVLSLGATLVADVFIGLDAVRAWLTGGFVLLGYLTHLVLDEAASVDLLDRKVKRSFGTALKPVSLRAWPWSLALTAFLIVLLGLIPDPGPAIVFSSSLGLPGDLLAAHWPRW